jgi:hypothetical protein
MKCSQYVSMGDQKSGWVWLGCCCIPSLCWVEDLGIAQILPVWQHAAMLQKEMVVKKPPAPFSFVWLVKVRLDLLESPVVHMILLLL